MDKDLIKAISEVVGFDVTDREECADNSDCNMGRMYDTKEEAISVCNKMNTLGKHFGWEKYKVYLYTYYPTNYYVCLTVSEYDKENIFYKPL